MQLQPSVGTRMRCSCFLSIFGDDISDFVCVCVCVLKCYGLIAESTTANYYLYLAFLFWFLYEEYLSAVFIQRLKENQATLKLTKHRKMMNNCGLRQLLLLKKQNLLQ